MASMLNNNNFEHWADIPKRSPHKMIALILGLLVFCFILAIIIVKSTMLFIVDPSVQVYNDVTEKIDRNIQSLNVTLDKAVEEAKKLSSSPPAKVGDRVLLNKSVLSNQEQANKQQKLLSAKCRFWIENDKNNSTERSKAEVAKNCGL